MAGKAKKIITAAGIAAATTGLAVVAKKRMDGKSAEYHVSPTDDGWEVPAASSSTAPTDRSSAPTTTRRRRRRGERRPGPSESARWNGRADPAADAAPPPPQPNRVVSATPRSAPAIRKRASPPAERRR